MPVESAGTETDGEGQWPGGEKIDLTWLRYLTLDLTCQDNAKEATGPLMTLQTWVFGQVVVMFLYVREHPKPDRLVTWVFLGLTMIPLLNLCMIIWANKSMKISQQLVHYFDVNSVVLARLMFLLILGIVIPITWQYSRGQLPGQSTLIAPKSASVHPFERGSKSLKIEPGEKGIVVVFPISKDIVTVPFELDLKLDEKTFAKWKVTGARNYKLTGGKRVLADDYPPATVGDGTGPTTIYLQKLDKDANYELEVYLFDRVPEDTIKKIVAEIVERGLVTGRAYAVPK